MRKSRKPSKAQAFETHEIPEKVLAKARKIAATYQIIIEPDPDAGYVARSLQLPGVLADGPTLVQCVKGIAFALETVIAAMLEAGKTPPAAPTGTRSEQVNIRLTTVEKHQLESEATRGGFTGLSDFVRSVALQACSPAR